MEDRSIRQNAGRDLTAVIDSFKGNIVEISRSGHPELQARLAEFLEAVALSPLTEDEKKTILVETQIVAGEAAAMGKLKGRTKLLWGGIKDAVSTIPKAVSAWESLAGLWS